MRATWVWASLEILGAIVSVVALWCALQTRRFRRIACARLQRIAAAANGAEASTPANVQTATDLEIRLFQIRVLRLSWRAGMQEGPNGLDEPTAKSA